MAGVPGGDWHNANGRSLPFRPPTVDEALPYSPLTSVVPFSPDIIPFPATEPPTPPTTLTPDQQAAARKAVGILNDEIRGPPSTAQHLEHTLRELRNLLGNPHEMTEFHFKPTAQLATPPPDSPTAPATGATPTSRVKLSPFASMLLKHTDVHYLPTAHAPPHQRKQKPEPPRQTGAPATSRTPSHPVAPISNGTPHSQVGAKPYPSGTPTPSATSAHFRSGPAVVIKPSTAPREEFQLYDKLPEHDVTAQQQSRDADSILANLRPQDREVAEQKIERLHRLVGKFFVAKDELDCEYFERISCLDADVTVMTRDTLDRLYDRVMTVCATSCFSSVSVEAIVRIHTLCEPSITASDQPSMFNEGELDSWANDLMTVESGLKASKLVLITMLEGPSDRRTSPEDLLTAIIQVVKRTLESCIYPVLASRRDAESETFTYASNHKQEMHAVLRLCTSVQDLLAQAIGKVPLTDSALHEVESLALTLLVQQNSDTEKDSALGIQRFEKLRQAAMDVLTQIFASYPGHQNGITAEILNNIEKLPDKGQNTRQFKSAREEPIMTVSALFMRFIQVAATNSHSQHKKITPASKQEESGDESESGSGNESEYESDRAPARKAKATKGNKGNKGNKSAEIIARKLLNNAQEKAQTIAKTLTERALNVSKSGEKPFRNLLDMFVDDFCKVLGSPEWPAATLLLVSLLSQADKIMKTNNSNKDMALSMLGTMGCGIIDFRLRIRQLKREVDISQSELSAKLHHLAEDTLESGLTNITTVNKGDLLTFRDPYLMVIESLPDYLKINNNQEDLHLLSVRGCYVSFWWESILQAMQSANDETANDRAILHLRQNVEAMILDSKWSSREYKYQNVSETQSRLAAGIITLKGTFCQYYPTIVSFMFKQIQEGGVNQKSRALRNIESFLDKDGQAISDAHLNHVANMLGHNSPLVRADVVSLVSKCLDFKPAMERLCLPGVMRLATDTHSAPKKKAINLLKKIYLRSQSPDNKLSIVMSLLPASQDLEKPIADMARQALEEVWLKVLDIHTKGDENQLKLQRAERVSLLVQTVRRAQTSLASRYLEAFENFFTTALASSTPAASVNFGICKEMVADLVEGVINPDSMASGCTQGNVLRTLSIFARVSPEMFTLDQIQLLKLYVKDPTTGDDVEILRSAVTVFRFVIPHLSNLQREFADEVWSLLNKVISKLALWAGAGNTVGKDTLLDVVHCLWIIRPLVTNGMAKLLMTIGSTLVQLLPLVPLANSASGQADAKKRLNTYLVLLGTFGKICVFSEHVAQFHSTVSPMAKKFIIKKPNTKEQLKSLLDPNGTAPSLILLEAVRPFTKQSWDLAIRENALCSMGEVCQGSPSLFQRSDVEATFKVVFKNDVESLKHIALNQFHDFFIKAERPSESEATAASASATDGSARLGITFQARDGQVTTNYLARKFLQEVVDIALKNNNELALVATNIIVSISRQGLVHPKECGPALIALGSSSNPQIAQTAAVEHKDIHSKHESMFEKEYMAAVKMAFEYQTDVFRDPHGMTAPPDCKPKMTHVFAVMKNGSRRTLKKFIDNLSKLIDFEFPKLDDPTASSTALLFARFCLENIALFDVPKLEDVAIITNALESIVLKNTGPTVGVAIDTEMPKRNTPEPQLQQPLQDAASAPGGLILPNQDTTDGHQEPISDSRLLQITRACMILQMMWETRGFVRRAYNFHKPGSILPKDYQKPASRNNLIKGTELWERFEHICNSVESRESMIKRCYEFAELLEVDKDAQFGDGEMENDDAADYMTPEETEEPGLAIPSSGRGRKRKSSASLTNTPKKSRGRPAGSKNKKRNSKTPELDDEWD